MRALTCVQLDPTQTHVIATFTLVAPTSDGKLKHTHSKTEAPVHFETPAVVMCGEKVRLTSTAVYIFVEIQIINVSANTTRLQPGGKSVEVQTRAIN